MQEDKAKSIEYDEGNDTWYVYLGDDRERFKCHNKDDAIFFDSNIKELYDGMINYELFKNDEDKRKNYIERLEKAVAIIKKYSHCIAFSRLISFEAEIPKSDRYW